MTWQGTSTKPTWTTLASNLSSGTARYTVVAGWVQVQVDGALSIATGTVATVTTAALPAELRPSIQVRTGGYFGGYPGTLTMTVNGVVTAMHQSGATRGSVSGVISYPVE